MAITDENTVLVLGAGVSVSFGLPLGGELINQISSILKIEKSIFFQMNLAMKKINTCCKSS